MKLEKLPGGMIYDLDETTRISKSDAVVAEAVHRQLGEQAAAALALAEQALARAVTVNTGDGKPVDLSAYATKAYAQQVAAQAVQEVSGQATVAVQTAERAEVSAGQALTRAQAAEQSVGAGLALVRVDMDAKDAALAERLDALESGGGSVDLAGYARTSYVDAKDAALSARIDALPTTGGGGTGTREVALSATVKGDGSDETATVQAALDAARTAGVPLVMDVPGVVGITRPLIVGDLRSNSAQVTVATLSGRLRLKALADIDAMVEFHGTVEWDSAEIECDGDSRACFGAIGRTTGRAMHGYLHVYRVLTSSYGQEPTGNNNLQVWRRVRAWQCGSKHTTSATVVSHTATGGWTGFSATPTASRWELSTPLPRGLRSRTWAAAGVKMADGRIMAVTKVDTEAGKWVEIAHENRTVGATETITIATAAFAIPYHGDSGAFEIGTLDLQQNPNAYTANIGGYGGSIANLTQQYNLGGVVIPMRVTGLSILHLYSEGISPMLTAGHVNHPSAGSQVFIGAGSKFNASIQVIDQGWMTMEGRDRQPPHWIIQREFPKAPVVVPPAAPLDLPEVQPGTRTLTPGTVQAYRRTSGTWAFRIDNGYPDGVGLVHLSSPSVGSGNPVQVTLLSDDFGETVEGSAQHTLSVFGEAMLAYWREGTTWRIRAVSQPGALASTASAPAYVGQTAVVGGQAYMAVGTGSASDWKQVTT